MKHSTDVSRCHHGMIDEMSRWKPDARGRLEQAAFELFRDRGYDHITVADIAQRAGLTERTFFRHYADKREVLFGGATHLQAEILRAINAAPCSLPTLALVRIGVEAAATMMHGRRELALERSKIVAAHADLQERDLIKRATLTTAIAGALGARGVAEPSASLAADMGMVVFHVGFSQWLDGPPGRELIDVVRDGFEELKAVASGA